MWLLRLNPVTDRAESVRIVAWAETEQQLLDFLQQESVEPYKDDRFHKVFRQGGPLEWYNPPYNGYTFSDTPAIIDVGTVQNWIDDTIKQYNDIRSKYMEVTSNYVPN